ncbi:eCIS core domain-containing protein [Pseudoduganella armeniaca]|uniref:eCIS core domain-containing protein n=1 Tax=Pseudoduganella armeniaca TaxID=2072590 RepID=A0A2R4CBX7_9BURK|nr:DUF4157 domain-containing protein [Pseudoduganella armeniaca]AVR97109.1 hypothetical protein C9I28_16750 [Pseudoduganella armeniaca]
MNIHALADTQDVGRDRNDGTAPGQFADRSPRAPADAALQLLADRSHRATQLQEQAGVAQRARTPNRTGLPDALKAGIESLSGMRMDHVRVHYGSAQPARMQAHAYAQDSEIHLGPGQERHLPHEAWHIVQQVQGRVRPTLHRQGVGVNDDVGLEREADALGQRALSVAAAPRPDAAAPAQLFAHDQVAGVAQLVDFPDDSVGTIEQVMATIREGEQKRDLTGTALQKEILRQVSAAGPISGCRLGSFNYSATGDLARSTAPDDENHGMLPLPSTVDTARLDPWIVVFVKGTLRQAGQLQYIDKNAEQIFATHTVVIDVDCQFDRRGNVGFHKDSRGTTVFFNLTFENDAAMQGPDNYEDLEGDPGLEAKLPQVLKTDIAARRNKMIRRHGGVTSPGVIRSPRLPAHGRISSSDPNLWHSTPRMGHRDPTPLTREQLIAALTPRLPGFDLPACDDELLRHYYLASYHSHGFEEASTRKDSGDEKAATAAKRERRLSMDLDDGTITQEALAAEALQARTFLRTWVRFVPRS